MVHDGTVHCNRVRRRRTMTEAEVQKTAMRAAASIAEVLAVTMEWSDLDDETAEVWRLVSRLRQIVGPRGLVCITEGMELRAVADLLDVIDFDLDTFSSMERPRDRNGRPLTEREVFPGAFLPED